MLSRVFGGFGAPVQQRFGDIAGPAAFAARAPSWHLFLFVFLLALFPCWRCGYRLRCAEDFILGDDLILIGYTGK